MSIEGDRYMANCGIRRASGYTATGKCADAPNTATPYTVAASDGKYSIKYRNADSTTPGLNAHESAHGKTLMLKSKTDENRLSGRTVVAWYLVGGDVTVQSDVLLTYSVDAYAPGNLPGAYALGAPDGDGLCTVQKHENAIGEDFYRVYADGRLSQLRAFAPNGSAEVSAGDVTLFFTDKAFTP